MRLDDAVTFFLTEWPQEGFSRPSPETVRTYGWQLRWLLRFAADRGQELLSDLTPGLLKAAMAAKESASRAHPTTHKGGEAAASSLACATKRLAGWLLAQGVPVADLESVKSPRVPERIQTRIRSDEFKAIEAVILRRLVDGDRRSAHLTVARDLALIYMLADTGLRAAEVCRMTLQSVDFTTGAVVIFRGKFSKPRALSVVDPDDSRGGTTLHLLADWIKVRGDLRGTASNESLWVSSKGKPIGPDELRRVLRVICQQAGIIGNRPPHTFRRANFTESYLAEPGSVNVLSARMGWSPRSHHMINVYTRGAEIDFARTTPIPSLSRRWHESTIEPPRSRPILLNGVGFGGSKADAPAPPTVGTRDGVRRASASFRRSSRHEG